MGVKFANNFETTISGSINSSVTTIAITSATGFPSLGAGDYAYCTLENLSGLTQEIVKVTAISGTSLTVVRAQEGTSASAFAAGDAFELRITATGLTEIATSATLAAVLGAGSTTGGTDLAVSAGDDITFTDSSKAIFGAGSDLQIYHDGSNSYIADTGTGALFLKTNYLAIAGANGNQLINAEQGGVVELYHNNAKKLETTSTGIDVTGTVTATGTSVFASLDISGDIDVDGTTNLDVVDIDGAVDMASTLAVAVLTANAGVVVDNFTLDGTTLALSSGDMTLDVAGDIILDADGDNIFYKAGGSSFYSISNVSGNTYLGVEQADKDLVIRGSDGGVAITALTLDMSAAGAATFNSTISSGAITANHGSMPSLYQALSQTMQD